MDNKNELLGANGKPLPKPEETPAPERRERIDPRRMDTGLLLYNLVRITINEVNLAQEIQKAEAIKAMKKHVGQLPGEEEIRAMLADAITRRSILVEAVRDRTAGADKEYFAAVGVEPYDPYEMVREENKVDETLS